MAAGQTVNDILQDEGRCDVDADGSGNGKDQADDEPDVACKVWRNILVMAVTSLGLLHLVESLILFVGFI